MLCPAQMLGYLLAIRLALTGTRFRPSLFRARAKPRDTQPVEASAQIRCGIIRPRSDVSGGKHAEKGCATRRMQVTDLFSHLIFPALMGLAFAILFYLLNRTIRAGRPMKPYE